MSDSSETELWEQRGGTGVDAEPYCMVDFADETIDIVVGVRLSVSVEGVIPEPAAGTFWAAFWDGYSEAFGQPFGDALMAAFGADGDKGIPWYDVDEYMRGADAMLQQRFEECGGRELEVARPSVPGDEAEARGAPAHAA